MAIANHPPGLVRWLTVSNSTYFGCSEITKLNFKRLALALVFTVAICGAVLAASLCEFWLDRNYYFLPLIFIVTALFYYLLDQAIIMGDSNRKVSWFKVLRVSMALVLGLFNSLLIDYYFFKSDIDAARNAELVQLQRKVGEQFDTQILLKKQNINTQLQLIDGLELRLSSQLDSLNAEANGMGGSQKRGIAAVWLAKYKSYQADSIRYSELIAYKRKGIDQLDKEINELKLDKEKNVAMVLPTISKGINKSLELLHKVVWEDGKPMNMMMSILVLLISMLIELVPLIAKSFYNIDEYFEVARHQKEICTTNAGIRKQNAINMEAARLMNKNALENAKLMGEHKIQLLKEEMENNKKAFQATEAFMDELIETEERWKKKYPVAFEIHNKPVIEKAYDALRVAS